MPLEQGPVGLLRIDELLGDRVVDDVGALRALHGRIQLVEVAAHLADQRA